MKYNYTKNNVKAETITLEIKKSSEITSELQAVTFTEPDILEIIFASEISSAEETELDSLVSAHAGQDLQGYRIYCNTCEDYKSFKYNTTPTNCPECDGTDIEDILEHFPPTLSTIDELGQAWDLFVLSDGSIITARSY